MDGPLPGEQLFRADFGNWELNACLNCYDMTAGDIADGYKQSADALVDAIEVSTNTVHLTLDLAIYPIVFLYRHYLELQLKQIIISTKILEREQGVPFGHRLDELWTEAKRLLTKHYKNLPPEFTHLQTCIDEFHAVDGGSMAFRYVADRQGKSMLKDIKHINVRNLQESMDRIHNLLDGVSMELASRIEIRCEMEAEARSINIDHGAA